MSAPTIADGWAELRESMPGTTASEWLALRAAFYAGASFVIDAVGEGASVNCLLDEIAAFLEEAEPDGDLTEINQ